MPNHKEIKNTLKLLLWLWFGVITSFTFVNVVNIARLETVINYNKFNKLEHQKCKFIER